ncbi:hypothetical protein [Dysgonomonas sp. 511]|uniref:hypothetical protein n=1 Tax=Dysgonomonas sp. 511 TaxID=2302930 RepID=UPI0013D14BC3|nr:hypothetical protein [Dysgonomonas sp. 511]NDV77548.1 hypothetical protein [Dysgonomonas sp. 511]
MKKLLLLFLSSVAICLSANACLNAYLFKVFPVGMCGDTIVSVDFQIFRNMHFPPAGEDINSLGDIYSDEMNWYIKAYITKYDRFQNPLETIIADSVFLIQDDCETELKEMYRQIYKKIVSENTDLQLFKTTSFMWGKFSNKVKGIEIKENSIYYERQDYPVHISNDSTYYGSGSNGYLKVVIPSLIGTVRKYTLDDTELIVVHTQMGQKLGKETDKPNITFSDIADAAYMEPILYHGNGIDYFITRQKKQ